MKPIKTFSNGQKAEYAIERTGAANTLHPVLYVDGVKKGIIWGMMNLDADGNKKSPKIINGKPVGGYCNGNDGKQYGFFEHEILHVLAEARQQREAASKEAKNKFWASEEGKKELARRKSAKEFDEKYNEGGEGYNPYR